MSTEEALHHINEVNQTILSQDNIDDFDALKPLLIKPSNTSRSDEKENENEVTLVDDEGDPASDIGCGNHYGLMGNGAVDVEKENGVIPVQWMVKVIPQPILVVGTVMV